MTVEVAVMNRIGLPLATELAIVTPPTLRKDRYEAGFAHALKGGQLDRVEYFKLSFREGYRAAKLYLRALRRKQGIVEFPLSGRLKFKVL